MVGRKGKENGVYKSQKYERMGEKVDKEENGKSEKRKEEVACRMGNRQHRQAERRGKMKNAGKKGKEDGVYERKRTRGWVKKLGRKKKM